MTEKILEERRKRKDQRASDQNQSTQNQTSKSDQIDVRSLAESVKRKSEALLKKTEQPVFDQPPTKRRRF